MIGNPEEERRAAFYHQPWAQEAVGRHIFAKVRLCPVCLPAVVSSRGLSCRSLCPPGAAAKAGTGTGAGNSPDLTAQGSLPFFPALEPPPPQPGRDHHVRLQTHRIRRGVGKGSLLLPSASQLTVVIGFLVAWSPKPYYLLYALALIGYTMDASAPCRQAQVRLLEALLCHCKAEVLEPKATHWLCLFTDSPLGRVP